ncbi:5'-nucleotidase /3'-nucleotidase /exopolyphosphatase [Sulfobacillus thermosulfidooxidans DSM 9293]|uniref:5'-nucleotidase n=1 Tax=Sulfobacillus thermosulfidooxidans (strain DSM 9293 / VKM B-1269 / AT-1) TaxID=929705 RepID=A0A1W1W8L7_SULTA|nr:5'/3'-nucleotidase SurE [Sulfobacillus thermosulfidooxidans]SMC02093.1 5'-nucleotidase /3'-nucleotidase /exopolyphosphatase [Sulfobacillus thermosulfidooxidans DSM 9293]
MGPILVTNDDGVGAMGLDVLITSLRGLGHDVMVVVPAQNHSGRGHSVTLGPVRMDTQRFHTDTWGYVVTGTPVDCVRLALAGACGTRPAMVVSGINHGWNVGHQILGSGTVAAAREAAWHQVPALALSASEGASWETLTRMLLHFGDSWLMAAAQRRGQYLNINLPAAPAAVWCWVSLDPAPIVPEVIPATEPGRVQLLGRHQSSGAGQDAAPTDIQCVEQGTIAVTALQAYPAVGDQGAPEECWHAPLMMSSYEEDEHDHGKSIRGVFPVGSDGV